MTGIAQVFAAQSMFVSSTLPPASDLAVHGIKAVLLLAPPENTWGHALGRMLLVDEARAGPKAMSEPSQNSAAGWLLTLTLDHTDESSPLLQLLPAALKFLEVRVRRGEGVLLLAPRAVVSSAVLVAWSMRFSTATHVAPPRQGVTELLEWSCNRPRLESSIATISQLHQRLHGPGSPPPSLPSSWLQQLRYIERAAELAFGVDGLIAGQNPCKWSELPGGISSLPTFSFAPCFENSVLNGTKSATTRLLRGPDRLAPVSTTGSILLSLSALLHRRLLCIRKHARKHAHTHANTHAHTHARTLARATYHFCVAIGRLRVVCAQKKRETCIARVEDINTMPIYQGGPRKEENTHAHQHKQTRTRSRIHACVLTPPPNRTAILRMMFSRPEFRLLLRQQAGTQGAKKYWYLLPASNPSRCLAVFIPFGEELMNTYPNPGFV